MMKWTWLDQDDVDDLIFTDAGWMHREGKEKKKRRPTPEAFIFLFLRSWRLTEFAGTLRPADDMIPSERAFGRRSRTGGGGSCHIWEKAVKIS